MPPLKPKSKVRLLDVPGTPEVEIANVGAAGFRVKGLGRTYWWTDRNRTWSSEELDRVDAVKQQFKAAAGGEREA